MTELNELIDDKSVEVLESIEADPQPWERRDDEGDRAWAAFCAYRDMGPHRRSVRKATEVFYGDQRNLRAMLNWCKKYDWVRRCTAYDRYIDDIEQSEWLNRRRKLRERDWEQGDAIREMAAKVLTGIEDFLTQNERFVPGKNGEPDRLIIRQKLDVVSMLKMVELASKLQRLAAGEPNESIQFSSAQIDALIKKEIEELLGHGDN